MKSNLRKALALLLTLIMVMTSLPTSALAEMVTDLAKSVTDVSEGKQLFGDAFVSPLSIVDDDTNKYYTYKFVVDDVEQTGDRQIVKNGDTLYEPASPEKEGHKFVGWYNGETKFNDFGEQSGITATTDVTLTAKFKEAHYVFFMDQNNRVFETREGINGTKIQADATFPVGAEEGITGWYTELALTNRVESVTIGNANITLYPKVEKGHWITFESVGGTYVKPAFYLPGVKTVQPENVTKPGYTLVGWYKDNDNAPFAFGTSLQENVTLTAKWEANTDTKYTVIYWKENANDDKYAFADYDVLTGTTGTQTKATASERYDGFTAQTVEVEQAIIEGDGSTIVNVYYKRNVYQVKFYEEKGRNFSENTLLRITAKYGANIKAKWPGGAWYVNQNGSGTAQAGLEMMPMGGKNFYGKVANGNNPTYYYVEVLPGETAEVTTGGISYKLDHVDYWPSGWSVTDEDKYSITGFTYKAGTANGRSLKNAKFYYIRNSYNVVYYNGDAVAYQKDYKYEADISGAGKVYTPTTPPAGKEGFKFEGWYADPKGTMAYDFKDKTMPAENILVYAKWVAPTVSGAAHTVMTGGDNPTKLTIAYGGTIKETDLPTPTAPAGDGWEFVCWATKDADGNFTPFNFGTIIYEDIVLYPYYVNSTELTITYDVNGDTTVVADERKYAINAYADVFAAPTAAAPAGKVFLGWKSSTDNKLYQPGDKVEMTGDITLYAIWGDQAATTSITYHANFGSDATYPHSGIKNNAKVPVKSYGDTGLDLRPGYTFKGWSTDPNATEPNVGETIRVDSKNASTTNDLYAVWEVVKVALTVEKQWLGDENYTDNRVPVTLTIGRRANGVEENWDTVELSAENAQSGNANVWRREFNVETHDEDGHAYTYYIKKEKATNTADQTKLNTYYTFVPGSGVVLTETGINTLTAKNTLATRELTITKQLDASVPNSYNDAKFEFTVTKAGESAPVSGLIEKTETGTRSIDKIELSKGGSITLILPIGTYSVAEKLTTDQQEIWAQPDAQEAKLEKDGAHLTFTNRLTTAAIAVKKVWLDNAEEHGNVIVSVTGSNGYSKTETFDTEKTFAVPTKTATGAAAQYTVTETETAVAGYATYYKVDNNGTASRTAPTDVQPGQTVTIYNVKTGSVEVQKKWNNISAADRDELTVKGMLYYTVFAGDEKSEEFTITKGNDGEWKTIIEGIPQYGANGKPLTFKVKETEVLQSGSDGTKTNIKNKFTVKDGDGLTITNNYKESDGYRTITVNKTWQRPAYMTTDGGVKAEFTLYRYIGEGFVQGDLNDLDNTAKWTTVDTKNLSEPKSNWKITEGTATADNTVSFAPVPKYDANGNEIIYAVKEAGELGYYTSTPAAKVDNTTNSVSFTNTMAKSATLTITKTAFDVDGETAVTEGTFRFEIKRVNGDANHSVTETIDLGKNESSKEVSLVPGTYTVTEIGADAWDTTYTVTDTEAVGTTMTREPAEGKSARVTTDGTVRFENTRKSVGEFTVYKKWEDSASQINVRPRPVQYESWLELWYKRNETNAQWQEYRGTKRLNVTTTEGSALYTITYSGMPEKATDGTEFIYAVKETIPADKNYYTLTVDDVYKVTGTDDAVLVTDGGTMTNTLSLGSLTIEKVIEDASDENYSVGFDFTVKLNGVDDQSVQQTITVDSAKEGKKDSVTIDNLPLGEYTVTETTKIGWTAKDGKITDSATVTASGNGTVSFTNIRDLYSMTVEKKWVDGENNLLKEKDQPDKLTVTITRSTGESSAESVEQIELTKVGRWTKTLPNLPRYTPDGTPYTYAVSEALPNGYEQKRAEVTFDSANNKYTATLINAKNMETPTKPTKTVTKGLIEVTEGTTTKMAKVGDKLTYTITYKNHKNTAQNVTITDVLPVGLELADKDWTLSADGRTATRVIENVAAFAEGSVTLTVKVTEAALNGSDPKVSNTAKVTIGGTTTESDPEETTIYNPDFSVEKTVVNQKAEYAEGETVEFAITVKNTGNVALENVRVSDVLDGAGVLVDETTGGLVNELTIASLAVGEEKKFTAQYIVKYDDLGGKTIPNVATVTVGETEKTDDASFMTEAFTTYTVTKVWSDDDNALGVRPDSVTVQLKRGNDVYRPAVLSADAYGNWSYTFEELPQHDANGAAYTYSVVETKVGTIDLDESDYTATISGATITNTLDISDNTLTVTKTWNDENDKYGLRPNAETFKDMLSLEQRKAGTEVWTDFSALKSVDDQYNVTFSGMPKYAADGTEYEYRIVEDLSACPYYAAKDIDYVELKVGQTGALTNELRTGIVTVSKTLVDESYNAPEKQTFKFYVNGAAVTSFGGNVTWNTDDNGAYFEITVKKGETASATLTLPVGTYTITEETNDAWTTKVGEVEGSSATVTLSEMAEVPQTVSFTNTRRMFNDDGEYTVTKYWNRYDENEAFPNVTVTLSDGARTRSVELKSEDVEVDGQNANLGSVSHIFKNLPAYDLDGNPLTYTAEESDVDGYTAQPPLSTDTSTTFTNTADAFALTVYKKWVDGDGNAYTGELPASVTVKLWRRIAGGDETLYKTATLDGQNVDESGRWYDAASFGGPTHDAEGRAYEYFVTEDTVEGFTPEKSRLTMADFAKETDASNLYSAELVNRKVEDGEKQPEKTVFADFRTVQITDETTGKMVEDGDELTYTIGYYNHLSVPATVVVTDALNENLAFDPADNPGAEYHADTHTVTWTIEGVNPCSRGSVELKVKVMLTDDALASEDPTISNTAGVQIGNRPVQTAASEDVTVYNPRLTVDKITANVPAKGYYALGETAEFEITASNTGNVLLENIVITEQLDGAAFVQGEGYTVDGRIATIAALNPGQSVVVRAQYTVKLDDLYAEDDQQQAPMKNIVTATAQSGDDPVDGGDESEFKPDQLTHLTVEKHWVDDLAVQRGDVRVQLTADGESYTADSRYNHEVIISSEDKDVWVMEFDNLPKHNADGSEIRYSAVETHVDGHGNVTDGRCDGYDVTVADDPDAHTTVITNTAQRKKFTVHKVWKDGEGDLAESLIPDTELTVALFVDGFDMNDDAFRTTLTRANGWEDDIDRMFAYNQAGVAYEYTPMEMDANGNAIADGGSIVIDGVTYDVSITTQTEPDANRADAHRDVTVTVTNTRRSDDPEENKPTKEANLAPGKTTVSVGDSLTYTISYHNSRNVKADVTITDVLAESLNFGSASHGGTYDPDTRTVTWVLRDVAAFASDAVTLTVTVNEKAKQADDAATVKNTATVVIPGNEPDIRTNTVEIPVEPEKGVKPTKKAVGIDPAKETVEIGQKVEYRIGYRNHKNTAVSVRIVDKLDDGVKFISASDGGVYDAAKHTVIWNIAKLAPFADGEVTLTVEVTEAARKLADGETMATVNNTATVKFDNDPETETNVVDIPVKPNDPKKPEKKAEGLNATDTKKVGDEIVYTITYVNNLNKKAKVVVTDALDEGVDFVEADNGGVYDKASHTVTWTFDSVDPFEGDAVKLTVKVNEKARQIKEGETTATVDNTAAVTVDNKTTTTSDPVEIPVTPDKPTDPTKKADDKALNSFGMIAVGDQLPFTVSYVNNLNTVATVTVRDTLEEGLTFVSADNGGTYDEATRTVTWVLKDVAPFTSGSVTVITEVNENAVDAADPTVANSAVVKIGDQPEQTTEPAEVTVYNPAFSVEKKLTNLPAKGYFTAGETAAFDITVKNTGNVPLENVAVEELLDGVTFVQGEGYTIDGRIATIAALPIGEQIVLKAEYTVIEADLGNTDLANRITVRGEVPENPDDPDQPHNPEDKGDEEPIPVDECVEITGTKTWNDADNAYGARPDVILVMLLANGEEKIGTRASAETEWKYTFIQQPKHDADGNEVVYSIREEEVPGYDTTYSAEGYDITNTLRRHTLTIRYWVDEVGGEQAFKTFTRDYYYGERYNVVSPAMDGYRADPEVVSGRIEGDLEVDVVYTAILWRLNIRYRRVGDGKTLAPMYTNGNVIIGDAYEVESPVIPGYTADRLVVKGEMHGRNMSFTVWYTPEQTEVVIVDEKTPFGLGNVVMNAGDCFE